MNFREHTIAAYSKLHEFIASDACPKGCFASFSIGESVPLATSDLLPVLVEESERMRAAFFAYRA
jgi:hypothetical protein